MPSGVIHECISKRLIDYLEIEDEERFLLGSIAPDSWRNSSSTKEGTHFYEDNVIEPKYWTFYEKYKEKMDDPFVLSYFIHLMTDYYWYENKIIGPKGEEDYWQQLHNLLKQLSDKYEIKYINNIDDNFYNPIEELDNEGINHTVDFVNETTIRKPIVELSSFSIEDAEEGIDETLGFIITELDKIRDITKK